ncbi:Z36L3 protein, partial [Polypterus senegalus]|nr:Z36L3 protein [Polypterus senegalus]
MLCNEQTERLLLYPYPEEEDHLFSSNDNAFHEEERRDPDEQKQPISKYKTEPCRTFLLFGICPYGSRCNFIHVEDNGEARPQLHAESPTTSSFTPGKGRPTFQSWKNRPSVACRNFAAFGFCLYGNRCHIQHNLEKRHLELMPTAESPDYYLNYPCLIQTRSRAASPVSDEASSTSVTTVDKQASNAFSFSDLLLPLTWRLQDLENGHQGLTPESDVFNL